MIQNKKELEDYLKQYNYVRNGNSEIILIETDKYIELELGGYWISRVDTVSKTDKDYEYLFNIFFRFLCNMASQNIPLKEKK